VNDYPHERTHIDLNLSGFPSPDELADGEATGIPGAGTELFPERPAGKNRVAKRVAAAATHIVGSAKRNPGTAIAGGIAVAAGVALVARRRKKSGSGAGKAVAEKEG
jgi:LPXTG-motif cell wall-anchored protein